MRRFRLLFSHGKKRGIRWEGGGSLDNVSPCLFPSLKNSVDTRCAASVLAKSAARKEQSVEDGGATLKGAAIPEPLHALGSDTR